MAFRELHHDCRKLADKLLTVPFGGTVTWAQLSAVIKADATKLRWRVASAQRLAQREGGIVLVSLRGIGFRRITVDRLAPDVGGTSRAKIRRTARRGNKAIAAGLAAANDIDNPTHLAALSEQTALGLLEHLAKDRQLPQLREGDIRTVSPADASLQFRRIIGASGG
jgi:hypothetical protein